MAYAHVILPGTIMRKHPFFITYATVARLTGVKTRVIRYLLGPTYTYAFLIRSWLKKKKKKKKKKEGAKKKKKRRKKKETDNQYTMKQNEAKRKNLDVTPLGQFYKICLVPFSTVPMKVPRYL